MTRARNIAGFSTITTTPSPVHVGPIGVLTATRIDGEFNVVDIASRDITAQGIGVTNLQVSGITTGLNVSGIITAQNGINFNGTSTGLNLSGVTTVADLSATTVSIAGTLTYEDVTNVDSVGVITARGLDIFGNTTGLNAGISTFTGDVSIADKIIHTGDTNTAIRFPSADTVSVETAGSEALRVDSSQRLVVGATSSNNVGGFGGAAFQVEGLTAGTSALSLIRHSANTVGSSILMGKTRGTSDGATTVVQSGDNVARIIAYGADGTDTESSLGAIQFDVDGTPGANDMPGRIVFSTTPDGAATYTERLRITSSGRIAVNDTGNASYTSFSPCIALGDSGDSQPALVIRGSSTSKNDISFCDNSGVEGDDGVSEGLLRYDHNGDYMCFHTADSEKLRITSDGKIGIGDATPSVTLETVGHNQVTFGSMPETIISYGTASAYNSGSAGGGINFGGYYNSTPEYTLFAGVHGVKENTTDGHYAGALVFSTRPQGAGSIERARITSGGKILAGTTSSREIAGGSAKLQVEATSSEGVSITRTSADNGAVYLSLGKTRNGSACQAGDTIGSISWNPDDGTDLNHPAAEIQTVVASGIGGNDVPGDLVFKTNGGATSTTERLRINSEGQIHKRQDSVNRTSLKTYSTGEGLVFDHYQLQDSGTYYRYADIVSVGDGGQGSLMRFLTMPNSGTPTEALRLDRSQVALSAKSFVSKSTAEYNANVSTASGFTANTFNVVLAEDVLDNHSVYIVNFSWNHQGSGQPYLTDGAFVFQPGSTNPGSTGAMGPNFVPAQGSHTEQGFTKYFTFRYYSPTGSHTHGLQAAFTDSLNDANGNGNLQMKIFKIGAETTI